MSKNIIITGFMGTGKTTIGQIVATQLEREFIDMDDLIETRQDRPISQIFAVEGEPYFRRLEDDLCRELAARSRLVIATGGGALVPETNLRVMERSGLVICLDCEADVLWERIGQSKNRPMLAAQDDERMARLGALLEQRTSAYGRVKQHLDVTQLTPAQAAEQICDWIREKSL